MKELILRLLEIKLEQRKDSSSVFDFRKCDTLTTEICLLEHLLLATGTNISEIDKIEKLYKLK